MAGWNRNGRRHADFPAAVRRQAHRALPRRCAHCDADQHLVLDHIIAGALGGAQTIDNAQWLCRPCNESKARMEADEGRRIRNAKRHRPREAHPLDQLNARSAGPSPQ